MTQAQRNAKILRAIKDETKRAAVSKKTAREALIKEGIYTVKGKLRVRFGGTTGKKGTVAA